MRHHLNRQPFGIAGSAGCPALIAAISMEVIPSVSYGTLTRRDITTLSSRILYFSLGYTKRLNFPWGSITVHFVPRPVPVLCGERHPHRAGYRNRCRPAPLCGMWRSVQRPCRHGRQLARTPVYHYNPGGPSLTRLRPGDYRGTLVAASGNEPSLTHAPAIILVVDIPSILSPLLARPGAPPRYFGGTPVVPGPGIPPLLLGQRNHSGEHFSHSRGAWPTC